MFFSSTIKTLTLYIIGFLGVCLSGLMLFDYNLKLHSYYSFKFEISTNEVKFKNTPQIYFNNNYLSPINGKIKNNKVTFENIPKSINHIRISFQFYEPTQFKIGKAFFLHNCNTPSNCTKLYEINSSNKLQNWDLLGGKFIENNIFLTDGPEAILLWGKTELNLKDIFQKSDKKFIQSQIPKNNLTPIYVFITFSIIFLISSLIRATQNQKLFNNLLIVSGISFGFCINFISAFPGHSNFDEFFSLNEYWSGNFSDTHAPMQTLIWAGLINILSFLNFGSEVQISSFMVLHLILVWVFIGIMSSQFKSTVLISLTLLFFIINPFFLSYFPHIGKDTILGIYLFISCFYLYSYHKNNNKFVLILGVFFLVLAFNSRSNAPAAIIPIIIYFSYVKFFHKKKSLQYIANSNILLKLKSYGIIPFLFVTVFGIFLLFSSSFVLNKKFVKNNCCSIKTGLLVPMHDLIGISYHVDKNLIPKKYLKDYDNALNHIKKTYYPPFNVNFNNLQQISNEDYSEIMSVWLNTIIEHPWTYLKHRFDITRLLLGITSQTNNYTIFSGFFVSKNNNISDKFDFVYKLNSFILSIKDLFKQYCYSFLNTIFFKPWFYILIFLTSLIIYNDKNHSKFRHLKNYLYLSSFFYVAPYFILVNSASTRYLYWPIFASSVILFLKLNDLISLNVNNKNKKIILQNKNLLIFVFIIILLTLLMLSLQSFLK